MFNLENKVLTIDGTNKYLVVETVHFMGRTFVYLVNDTNPLDSMYREVVSIDAWKIIQIDPTLFKDKILPLFIEKFKSYRKY